MNDKPRADEGVGSVRNYETLAKARAHITQKAIASLYKDADPENLFDDKKDLVGGTEDIIRPKLRATLKEQKSATSDPFHEGGLLLKAKHHAHVHHKKKAT